MPDRAPPPANRRTARAQARLSDPSPERALSRRLHAYGLRFARQPRALPGRPDLVLPRRHAVVFVHGRFWHGHGCALDHAADRFRAGTWAQKIAANQAQFARDRMALHAAGWHVETVWECQIDDGATIDRLVARLCRR